MVINGQVFPVGGTSASSPTFAAILSRLNSVRLSQGKRTLGWVNPLLYSLAAAHVQPTQHHPTVAADSGPAFHDVTRGNNAYGECVGFDAAVGWDPMTGLGTPNYPALLSGS